MEKEQTWQNKGNKSSFKKNQAVKLLRDFFLNKNIFDFFHFDLDNISTNVARRSLNKHINIFEEDIYIKMLHFNNSAYFHNFEVKVAKSITKFIKENFKAV